MEKVLYFLNEGDTDGLIKELQDDVTSINQDDELIPAITMEEVEQLIKFGTNVTKEDFVNSYEPRLRASASYVWDTYKRCDQSLFEKMNRFVLSVYSKMTQKLKDMK